MSSEAVIRLRATDPIDMPTLALKLAARLNRRGDPPIMVAVTDHLLCFQSETWQPILLARVEEALDELVGTRWSLGFMWT